MLWPQFPTDIQPPHLAHCTASTPQTTALTLAPTPHFWNSKNGSTFNWLRSGLFHCISLISHQGLNVIFNTHTHTQSLMGSSAHVWRPVWAATWGSFTSITDWVICKLKSHGILLLKLISSCQGTDPEFIILLVRVAVRGGRMLRRIVGKEKGGESVGNELERWQCFRRITFSLSQLIILFVSGAKYPVEEDQLFIPESIYHGKQTHTPLHTNKHPRCQCSAERCWAVLIDS